MSKSSEAWDHVEACWDEYEYDGHSDEAKTAYIQALRDFLNVHDEEEPHPFTD